MSNIVDIKKCEKLYADEWLLFEVVKVDKKNQPVKGKLLAHSKDREEVHKVAMVSNVKELYCLYTGDLIPKDMAVVL